ncbi:MAG: hypothetical protein HC904_16995 [Blastochloris sp.]|nr:hypothetical protein [Blastochloris sp.]
MTLARQKKKSESEQSSSKISFRWLIPPRDGSAYIVLGVRCYPDGRKELNGLGSFPDDADLQSKFDTICYPHPRFKYEPVLSSGKQFAFIEIADDKSIGPILPIKDVGNVLRKHTVYHRRNSQNAMADVSEQKRIYGWFRESIDLRPQNDCSDPLWDKFLRAVHEFESSRKYILITSPGIVEQGDPAENLANVPWLLVADFDHESQESGLLSRVSIPLSERVSLHRITIETDPTINSTGATYWYFARGIEGRKSTLSTGVWIDWQKKYAKDVQKRLTKLAGATNAPVTIVALWAEPSLCSHLDSF